MGTLKDNAEKKSDSVTPDIAQRNRAIGDSLDNSQFRILTNSDLDTFVYGLNKYEDSKYEDPTYLGFTVEIDAKSAIFTDLESFIKTQADKDLIEFKSRLPIYYEFVNKIKQIFNSQESVQNDKEKQLFIKQHYINSIDGFSELTKKFAEWKKDKLTVELHEDIALTTTYLSSLYNNLIYSYNNGRIMIPENLLYFNLNIRISEIRNLTSIGDKQIRQNLKYNITTLEYRLSDCYFDFFETQPVDSSITQSGIDQNPPNNSINKMSIYYKNVGRQIYTPLITNSISMNDRKTGLDIIFIDGNATSIYRKDAFNSNVKKPSSLKTYDEEIAVGAADETRGLKDKDEFLTQLKDYNKKFAPIVIKPTQATNSVSDETLIDKLKTTADTAISDTKKYLKLQAKREAYMYEAKAELAAKNTYSVVINKLKVKRDEIINKVKELVIDSIYPNPNDIKTEVLEPLSNLYKLKYIPPEQLTDKDNVNN